MSQISEFRCDRCGGDCGNGGVFDSLVVSDMDAASGRVVNLHFCRTRYDQETGAKITGCDSVLLKKADLAYYLEENGTTDLYVRPEGTPPPPPQEPALDTASSPEEAIATPTPTEPEGSTGMTDAEG